MDRFRRFFHCEPRKLQTALHTAPIPIHHGSFPHCCCGRKEQLLQRSAERRSCELALDRVLDYKWFDELEFGVVGWRRQHCASHTGCPLQRANASVWLLARAGQSPAIGQRAAKNVVLHGVWLCAVGGQLVRGFVLLFAAIRERKVRRLARHHRFALALVALCRSALLAIHETSHCSEQLPNRARLPLSEPQC